MRSLPTWRMLPVFLLLLAFTVPALPAMAQDAGSILSVDTPTDGQMNELGQDVVFVGWAANRLGTGSGVDRVMVLDAPMAAGGVTVAEATYGLLRQDVGNQYVANWSNSGFRATWRAVGATGNRTFWVYAHSVDNDGWTNKTVTLRETEASVPVPAAVAPVAATAAQTLDQNQANRNRNSNGLYGNSSCDQYNMQYGNQYGTQYNGQYANQYNNQNQNCNMNGQYNNSNGQYYNQNGQGYNSQYPNQYDQYGNPINQYNNQYGQYANGQYQCDQYGNLLPNSGTYNTQYPYGSTPGDSCSGYPTNNVTGSSVVGTTAADGSIVVTWAPNAGATQGYHIWLISPSTYLASTVNQSYGSSASTTIGGLAPNSSVTIQVRAVSSNNTESAIAAYLTMPTTVVTVAAPLSLTVGTTTSTTVNLSWTPSVTGSITSYLVQQSPISGGPFTPSVVSNASSNGAMVTGLLPHTTYFFEVTAMQNALASPPSTVVSALTAV